MLTTLLSHLSYILPELTVLIGISFMLMLESNYPSEAAPVASGHGHDDGHGHHDAKPVDITRRPMVLVITGLMCLLALGLLAANLSGKAVTIFDQSLMIDQFSTVIKMLLLVAFGGLIYLHATTKDWDQPFQTEFLALGGGVLLGSMMLASSMNLLMVYVSLETMSILSYVLCSLKKNSEISAEAGLKYFIYGGVSAALMLFGLSHLYGIAGTFDLGLLCQKINLLDGNQLLALKWCLILFFAGLGFKVSAFPFHQWSPDVYEGAPLTVTAFFSLIPKFAALALLARFTYTLSYPVNAQGILAITGGKISSIGQWWQELMVFAGLLTMTVANLCAMGQESVKRLLAYSSMANIGILMLLLGLTPSEGPTALLFYASVYIIMTLGAFYAIDLVVSTYKTDTHYFFKGLIFRNPWSGLFFVIILFSFAGLPPFAGFIAKFNIFMLLLSHQYFWASTVLAVNSIFSLYYYLRLIKTVAVDKPDDASPLAQETFLRKFYLGALTLPLLILGLFWESIYYAFKAALMSFL